MNSDLLDIIKDIKPSETPLLVLIYMKSMSKEEAWKKYRAEMENFDPTIDF